jgi:hypothetical protein
VNETFQVPGATLEPGQYVVKLSDSTSNRHIVQFYNQDQSRLIATTLAINNSLMEPEGDTQLRFYETKGNEPPALRAWFYPGDTFGQEFVYGKEQARVIARKSDRNVTTMDDDDARQFKTRSDQNTAGIDNTRVYSWSPQDRELSTSQASDENSHKDKDPASMARQKEYQRYGKFSGSSGQNVSSSPGANKKLSAVVVTRTEALPANWTADMSKIDSVMQRVEQHGDVFESAFQDAIKSSTIPIEERDDMIARIDRLEDELDKLRDEYKDRDMAEAHKHLRRALEIGAGVNRFMLRSEFGKAEDMWSALRSDLNTLAEAHTFPILSVYVIQPAQMSSSR